MYKLQFDGQYQSKGPETSSGFKAGLMGYGWLIFKNGQQAACGWGVFAQGKNAASNIAEYLALIEGLEALLDMKIGIEAVEIWGDARSVLDQMTGLAPVHSQPTMPYFLRARQLSGHLRHINWLWVPRSHNKKADQLSRQAIRQMHRTPGAYQKVLDAIVPGRPRLNPVFDLRVYQPVTV
jgi:ribonuclease HI